MVILFLSILNRKESVIVHYRDGTAQGKNIKCPKGTAEQVLRRIRYCKIVDTTEMHLVDIDGKRVRGHYAHTKTEVIHHVINTVDKE